MNFSKRFETVHGEIVLINTTNDKGNPCIKAYFQPEGLGVCCQIDSMSNDSEKDYKHNDSIFEKMDEESAIKTLLMLKKKLASFHDNVK